MALPSPPRGLFIDIPTKGTLLIWWEVRGDQYSSYPTGLIIGEAAWKPIGGAWEDVDVSPHLGLLGGAADFAQFLWNMLKASEIDVTGWITADSLESRRRIDEFLARPRGEVDAMIIPWLRDKLLPALRAFVAAVAAPFLAGTGGGGTVIRYANADDLLNSGVLGRFTATVSNGAVNVAFKG